MFGLKKKVHYIHPLKKQQKLNVRDELNRRKSQAQRILERIKLGNATNVDLARIGTRYTERVRELRKEGHDIKAVYERPGLYRYIYKSGGEA